MTKKVASARTWSTKEQVALRDALVTAIRRRLRDLDVAEKVVARQLHAPKVTEAQRLARRYLERYQDELLEHFASGSEVQPRRIRPRLVVVSSLAQARLFRYAALHWSVPVSSGYGRRMRFLVEDAQNGKLIGVIGIGDPVFALHDRDEWIGWSKDRRQSRLRCVMDAFVLGAVPPYSMLLGGKLVAAMATGVEVRNLYRKRYWSQPALISGRRHHLPLVMLTTTSAYGRSSLYNRVRLGGRELWTHVGETAGHGEFLVSAKLYARLAEFVDAHAKPLARSKKFGRQGRGWRNRREVLRTAIGLLDLPYSLHVHGLRRAIYVAPLGRSARGWLRGTAKTPGLYRRSASAIAAAAIRRWVIPRSERNEDWRAWSADSYRLWGVRRERQRAVR